MPEALFDPLARIYAPFAEITHARYRPWVESAVPANGRRAIELGCGSGQFLALLADRFEEVVAVDVSAAMIETARRRVGRRRIDYRVGDIRDATPGRVGTFDLVFSVNTLHHLGDPRLSLPHVRDLVGPGGTLVVIDYVTSTPAWARAGGPAYRLYRWARGLDGAVRAGLARRSVGDARAMYRLRRDPHWRRLAAGARTLDREAFRRHYSEAFPGARISAGLDRSVCAVAWTRPAARARPDAEAAVIETPPAATGPGSS
ncbi:class I SAM-dependent methyltransferase [Nocardia thailandica]